MSIDDLIEQAKRQRAARSALTTSAALTKRQHCGGCGGPRCGRSCFDLVVSGGGGAHPAGTPLPAMKCNNCGRSHSRRGGFTALAKALRKSDHPDAPALAELAQAAADRRVE